ncbi:MAG: PAC2 family protein [Chloroflexota bacterium]
MDLGAFHIPDPPAGLREPHVLAMLRPWVDVGSVGAMALTELEHALGAQPLGQLAKPGRFFDFTRYRPNSYFVDGVRNVDVPNTFLRYARGPEANDFIILRMMEPHNNSEDYVESVMAVMDEFSAKRYVLMGAMYDLVPHTRPLQISGSSSNMSIQETLHKYGVRTSTYEGPTTILTQIPQLAAARGMETLNMLVRLPQYAPLDEDYAGKLKMLEVLSEIYGITLDLKETRSKAEDQLRQVSTAVEANPQLKRALTHLEERYDARGKPERAVVDPPTPLPPAIEQFLRELD